MHVSGHLARVSQSPRTPPRSVGPLSDINLFFFSAILSPASEISRLEYVSCRTSFLGALLDPCKSLRENAQVCSHEPRSGAIDGHSVLASFRSPPMTAPCGIIELREIRRYRIARKHFFIRPHVYRGFGRRPEHFAGIVIVSGIEQCILWATMTLERCLRGLSSRHWDSILLRLDRMSM